LMPSSSQTRNVVKDLNRAVTGALDQLAGLAQVQGQSGEVDTSSDVVMEEAESEAEVVVEPQRRRQPQRRGGSKTRGSGAGSTSRGGSKTRGPGTASTSRGGGRPGPGSSQKRVVIPARLRTEFNAAFADWKARRFAEREHAETMVDERSLIDFLKAWPGL